MSNATLTTIRAALKARMDATLLTTATPAGPFAQVANWAGEVTPQGIQHDALGAVPAALLALNTESYGVEVESTLAGPIEFIARPTWTVYVVHYDPREPGAFAGETAADGLTPLLDAVLGALSGLVIAGLNRSETVRPTGTRPVYVRPGEFVYGINFVTERAIEPVAPTDDSVDYLGTTADVTLEDTDDAVPASLDPFLTLEDS